MEHPIDPRAHERTAVERAGHGDHDAFVELYRQEAPTAWRLALALTREPGPAADAVVEGFRRVLAPSVAPAAATEVPFQLRLLAATRHAVLDASATVPARGDVVLEQPGPTIALPHLSQGTVAAMAAFHALPERWRSVLWLLTVEGLGSAEVAQVLALRPQEAEELAERARAGLQQQWERVRDADAPDDRDPTRHLAPLVPLPLTLFDRAERRWRAALTRRAGPLGLALPGGRPVPAWAERTLIGATGLLIALGITGALLSDRQDTAPRDDRSVAKASVNDSKRRKVGEDKGGDSTVVVDEPTAYLDGAAPPAARERSSTTTTTLAVVDPSTGEVVGFATVDPTPAPTATDEPPPTTTTTAPLLQVNAGVAPLLGLSVGTQCGGIELLGTVIGCDPPTKDEGITLEGSSRLLGG